MKYILSALLMVSASLAFADDFDAVEAKLKAAMAADIRTDAEKERDRNRRPIDTLKFFGLRDDMKIGDTVFIYGNKSIYAIGEIEGEYEYVQDDFKYTHRRLVNWQSSLISVLVL